jgi:hypothetical protein
VDFGKGAARGCAVIFCLLVIGAAILAAARNETRNWHETSGNFEGGQDRSEPSPQKGDRITRKLCKSWQAEWPPAKPSSKLVEMSGIVRSRMYQDMFYHVTDSGNDPIISVTDSKGEILREVRYRQRAWDVEALSTGPCPWGGSCLFAADIGDNFKFRSNKRIDVIDEKSMFMPPLRGDNIEFKLPDRQVFDMEALAVHPLTGDLYIFSKEPHKSRIFWLPGSVWKAKGDVHKAVFLGEIAHGTISDAAWNQDGTRIAVISSEGIWERAEKPGFEMEQVTGWYAFERYLDLPILDQQEAISYLEDDRSVVYSSEKKLLRNERWGIVLGQCRD